MNIDIKELISKMTLEEKCALCSGKDFWSTKPIERLGIKSMILTDGPHGVRKQSVSSESLSLQKSVKTTCFPTASCTACSFDIYLLHDIGSFIAKECKAEDVSIVLGPAINIKRSPLCGRNFEYFSEDPFLTGEIATSWVRGVEDNDIGSSLKHFACNNQETLRLIIDVTVDERALREIYLYAFERVVKEAMPSTLMCAYNKVNGEYASESKYLLNDILREEWGYKGFVMSDWGAVNNRVEGLKSGLDLQMPSTKGYDDKKIADAVRNGSLDMEVLDKTVERILEITFNLMSKKENAFTYDREEHHNMARKAAEASIVLLKNEEDILPLKKEISIAVIGEFAQNPRFQGNGSSLINAFKVDTASEYFSKNAIEFNYARGYDSSLDNIDKTLINEAIKTAINKDAVIIFAGLINSYESEGFDRKHMRMPESHNVLIDAVSAVNENVIVVLALGSPVEMPWIGNVKALVNAYLAGEAGISAIFNIIFGKVNPSGKLAETFPIKLEDNPSYNYFPGGNRAVEYRESIYVGYRYYDKAKKKVLFPFGFGMSYTSFEFSNIEVTDVSSADKPKSFEVSFEIKNTGARYGAEVAQLYVSSPEDKLFKAKKELKGFKKVFLHPNESKTVTISLDKKSFSFYDVDSRSFEIENGLYTIYVGNSSRNLPLSKTLEIVTDRCVFEGSFIKNYREKANDYYDICRSPFTVREEDFKTILGRDLPKLNEKLGKPYHLNNNLLDIKDTVLGKNIYEKLEKGVEDIFKGDKTDTVNMFKSMILETPFRTLPNMSGGLVSREEIEDIINKLNE